MGRTLEGKEKKRVTFVGFEMEVDVPGEENNLGAEVDRRKILRLKRKAGDRTEATVEDLVAKIRRKKLHINGKSRISGKSTGVMR